MGKLSKKVINKTHSYWGNDKFARIKTSIKNLNDKKLKSYVNNLKSSVKTLNLDTIRYNSTLYAPALLRITLSLVFLWFGYSQIVNTSSFVGYLPEFISYLPVSPENFVLLNGVLEVTFGILLIIGLFTRFSASLLGLHLLGIAFEIGLTSTGVRDFGLAFATLSIVLFGPDIYCMESKFKKQLGSLRPKNLKPIIFYGIIILLLLSVILNFALILKFFSPEISLTTNTGDKKGPISTLGWGSTLNEAEVSKHGTDNDCWLIIENKVYDVTAYIPFHPGGKDEIISRCGTDATTAFNTKGGTGESHSSSAISLLSTYLIGTLGDELAGEGDPNDLKITSENKLTNETEYTDNSTINQNTDIVLDETELLKHDSTNDCWLLISGKIYDVTAYIPFHPGGQNKIIAECGGDASNAFNGQGHSNNAKNLLSNYWIGNLDSAVTRNETIITPPASPDQPYRDTIEGSYPGAIITKLSLEDDGKAEFKFTWNGETYEGKMDTANQITEIE